MGVATIPMCSWGRAQKGHAAGSELRALGVGWCVASGSAPTHSPTAHQKEDTGKGPNRCRISNWVHPARCWQGLKPLSPPSLSPPPLSLQSSGQTPKLILDPHPLSAPLPSPPRTAPKASQPDSPPSHPASQQLLLPLWLTRHILHAADEKL